MRPIQSRCVGLMPVTDVQESCTRNLHVCHSDLQQDFSRASFLRKIEHVIFTERNLQSSDSMHTC